MKKSIVKEDLSLLLESDLATILSIAAASEVDRNEERLRALLPFLRHRVLKLIRSREAIVEELREFGKTLERIENSHLPRLFPWFMQAVKELAELLIASESSPDCLMAIKRHLPLSWEVLRELHKMNGTPILLSKLESRLCKPEDSDRYGRCWVALLDARLILLHTYSYRLDRTFHLAGCDACDAIDHIRDNEDPPRIPTCGKCGSEMKVLEEGEEDSIHDLHSLVLQMKAGS